MILVLALLGCTDPGPLALSACQAVPGLSTDAAGLALLEPLLIPTSVEILRAASPTLGQQALGAAGLAKLRAGTTCTVDQVDPAGSGRWAVALTRTAPSVGPDGVIGEPVVTPIEWQVSDIEGGRVDIALERASAMRRSSEEALAAGELRRAASTLRALSHSFPDPALAVDAASAEARLEKADYKDSLSNTFVSADGGLVRASFTNGGERGLSDVSVDGNFETPDGPVVASATLGAVAAGATVDYQLTIPDDAQGTVKLATHDYTLQ